MCRRQDAASPTRVARAGWGVGALQRDVEEVAPLLHALVVADDAVVLGAGLLGLLTRREGAVPGDQYVEGECGQHGRRKLLAHTSLLPHLCTHQGPLRSAGHVLAPAERVLVWTGGWRGGGGPLRRVRPGRRSQRRARRPASRRLSRCSPGSPGTHRTR